MTNSVWNTSQYFSKLYFVLCMKSNYATVIFLSTLLFSIYLVVVNMIIRVTRKQVSVSPFLDSTGSGQGESFGCCESGDELTRFIEG
jgi:hypothetical protein